MNRLSRRDFGKWFSVASLGLTLPSFGFKRKPKEKEIVNVSVSTDYLPSNFNANFYTYTTVVLTYDNQIVETYQSFNELKQSPISGFPYNGTRLPNSDIYVSFIKEDKNDKSNLAKHTLTLHHKYNCIVVKSLKLSSIMFSEKEPAAYENKS